MAQVGEIVVRHFWQCANGCSARSITAEPRPHSRFHSCPKLGGITAPLVEVGTKVKVYAVEREDYVGDDLAQYDESGKAIMAVITEREDGQDVTVLAPTAVMRLS